MTGSLGHFGDGQVFKDVDSIQLGDDFIEVITRAVGSCDVLLALIGKEWLTATDEHERRRLDNPDDFVRLEIEAALSRRVLVIPVLVEGARIPSANELPSSLAPLVRRQALELSPARFDSDTSRLLRVLDRTLAQVRATPQDADPLPAPAGTASDLSLDAPEQPEQAGRSPTPGTPPDAPAAPGGRPPSESGKTLPERHRRPSARARVLAGAGVGVVLTVVIAAVVANSGTTPPTTGASTATPPATGGSATAPPPANGIIFQDNFSSKASEWLPYQEAWTGRYANGTYRISAPPSTSGDARVSSPRRANSVYPSAPSNIRIEVRARRLPASDQNMIYGIACRIHGYNAYVLTITNDYASIERYGAYKLLKEANISVNANSANRLQAVCASVKGKRAVRLELWVNGQKAAETTDADNPLPTGTVGLVVGIAQTKRVSMAEFDNFTVSRA